MNYMVISREGTLAKKKRAGPPLEWSAALAGPLAGEESVVEA